MVAGRRALLFGIIFLLACGVVFVTPVSGVSEHHYTEDHHTEWDGVGSTVDAAENVTVQNSLALSEMTPESPVTETESDEETVPDVAPLDRTDLDAFARDSGPNIQLTMALSLLPERKGTYEVTHEYETPENLQMLEATLPPDATVTGSDGFVLRADRTYEWDRTTSEPSITYEQPANRTVDQTGPIAGPGRLIFVDVGDWALVQRPAASHRWGWEGQRVGLDREMQSDVGATGDVIAFLGDHETETHDAHGQEFTLVVPDAADLAVGSDDLFDSLSDASNTLRVGERDEQVFMVAAPTGTVDWGVRGLQTGPADLWTRDNERLDDPDNVWLHEYVHTRQGYTAGSDLRWFTEGTATYYAALLSLEQERISFDSFRNRLNLGNQSRLGSSVLAEPPTWQRGADYNVGALVSGELDRQLRLATGGEQSFEEVFRKMNTHEGLVTAREFQQFLEATAGSSVADLGETYTQTTQRPTMWDQQAHDEAFGPTPARITYSLSPTDPLSVSGEYRDRTIGPNPVLVPGEKLTVEISAENFGGSTGEYDVALQVDGEVRERKTGSLDPGESTPLSFAEPFEETGEFTLSVGSVDVPVSVREPATPEVHSLFVSETDITVGETVTLDATVENHAAYPGRIDVPLLKNDEEIDRQLVRLDAESGTTLSFEVTLEEEGTYVLGLGDTTAETVIVTVEKPEADPLPGDDTDDDVPNGETEADDDGAGLGVGIALAGLFVLFLATVTRTFSVR